MHPSTGRKADDRTAIETAREADESRRAQPSQPFKPSVARLATRKDSFASRLTAAQQEELFTQLSGSMTYKAAAEKIVAWSRPERITAPTEQAIAKWFKRMKVAQTIQEMGTGQGGPGDAELAETSHRGLRRAKLRCVLERLKPMEVASFERNELAQQRLELAERKHEYKTRVTDRRGALGRTRPRSEPAHKEIDLGQQLERLQTELRRMTSSLTGKRTG